MSRIMEKVEVKSFAYQFSEDEYKLVCEILDKLDGDICGAEYDFDCGTPDKAVEYIKNMRTLIDSLKDIVYCD